MASCPALSQGNSEVARIAYQQQGGERARCPTGDTALLFGWGEFR